MSYNPIISIDFGSSNSYVSIWKDNKINVIPNKEGIKEIPTYITFLDDEILVGNLSKMQSTINPRRTIFDIKRLIGYKDLDELYDLEEVMELELLRPFKVKMDPFKLKLNFEIISYHKHKKQEYKIEELLALIFEKIKNRAHKSLGKEVKDIIITIPSHFNNIQKKIIRDSATIAGLNIIRFLDESIAVGLSYCYERQFENEKKILIYNLGYSFLSISIISIKNGVFKVLSTSGKTYGGQDFDKEIINKYLPKYYFLQSPKGLSKFINLCEQAKIQLSSSKKVFIEFNDFENYEDIKEELKREEFEEMCNFDKYIYQIEKIIKNAHMDKNDIDLILLSGGSVNIPIIKEKISKIYVGKQIEICPNNKEAAVIGTSIYSAYLSNITNEKIKNFNPIIPFKLANSSENNHDIKDINQKNDNIYELYILPSNNKIIFDTSKENQKSLNLSIDNEIKVHIVIEQKSYYLCKLSFDHIFTNPNKEKEIEVIFSYDSNYDINAIAKEKKNGKEINITIEYDDDNIKQQINLNDNEIEDLKNKQDKRIKKMNIKNIDKYLIKKEKKNSNNISDKIFDDNNYIIGEFLITEKNVNKNIRILGGYEKYKKETSCNLKEGDKTKYNYEDDISNNCRITINDKFIPFTYEYAFNNEGRFIIKYSFKKNLTNLSHFFSFCYQLISIDLSHFNSKNVASMNSMFSECQSLISINFSNFTTQNVNDMNSMFSYCNNLINLNLSNFNTQKVINMSKMFNKCSNIISLNLSNFNTQNVTDMSEMFSNCYNLTNLNISSFNTQKVINMQEMFHECKLLKSIDLSNFQTPNLTNIKGMFYECEKLINVNISSLNTQNITNMSRLFYLCKSLISLDLTNFNTQNVTDMTGMFGSCYSLKNLKINFNTQNVIYMNSMFNQSKSLLSVNVANFDTKKVIEMESMFSSCESLTELDVSNFVSNNVKNCSYMFFRCNSLKVIDLSNFDLKKVAEKKDMFKQCSAKVIKKE